MRTKEWMMVALLAVGMNVAEKVLAGTLESTDAAWAIPYGQEFWRQAQPESKTAEVKAEESAAALAKSGVNIGDVMERVACSFHTDTEGEAPAAEGRTYRAVYEGNGIAFSPFLPAKSNVVEKVSEEPPEARLEKRRMERPDPATRPSPDPETAARFRTVRVTAGDAVLYDAASSPAAAETSALGNTIQRRLNAEVGLVEHWQTRRESMEVAWVLQRPALGGGPLVIELEATGLNLVGTAANAAHYGNGGAGRVRISGATAVDAAGKRCELAMRTDGGRIAYELPAAFLASAVYPLAVDPIISAEFGMGNPVHLPAAYNQMSPSVAWDGSHFLVVWQDWRNGSSSDIYGARVSSAGAVLDTLGIPVDSNPGYQQYLAVAAGSNGQSLVECQGWRYGAYRTVGVMIQDDPAVTVAATDPTAGESGTGQRTGTFRFTRTAPLTAALTVNFTVSGSATAGRDYTSIGTTVRFAVGSATATKTVSGINDSLVERDETVRVTLAGGTGYNVGSPSSATVTIKDDDT